jgi:hypothetical protein
MDILETMKARHAVRSYLPKPIEEEKKERLQTLVKELNQESGLDLQAFFDEPKAFSTFIAHYGHFENVANYLALVGPKGAEETIGYEGEKFVLELQAMGLNSCWVGLTYGKRKTSVKIQKGEKSYGVIAFGYGKSQGVPHVSKDVALLTHVEGEKPSYWDLGVEAALLAPTAVNQQKFRLSCIAGKPHIALRGNGFFAKVDLGIVKCHFELASGVKIDG